MGKKGFIAMFATSFPFLLVPASAHTSCRTVAAPAADPCCTLVFQELLLIFSSLLLRKLTGKKTILLLSQKRVRRRDGSGP